MEPTKEKAGKKNPLGENSKGKRKHRGTHPKMGGSKRRRLYFLQGPTKEELRFVDSME